jgi:TonB-linked SusC/RagA family outer membrane protein
MKKFLFCCVLLVMLCVSKGFTQTIITGTAKDARGETLPGVSVKLKGTSEGVSTNTSGNYSINIPQGNGVLVFSFIGMQNQEVEISGRKVIDVTLLESIASLQEVVVVGYGSQSRETVTTSISKLDTKVLANVPFANVASALQGALSGVRVQTTTGMPGAAPRIIIRGGTSINNPDGAGPLYVVDGVIRSNINSIDQSDIESLQVLKDAAATSIYGARASNGVVIIATKSGKSGKAVIDYRYDMTLSDNVEKYDLLSAKDYIYYQRLGIYRSATWGNKPAQLSILSSASSAGTGNDLTNNTAYTTQYLTPLNQHKLKDGWQSMPDPIDPTKTIIFDDFDFQNTSYRTGVSGNHSITTSGGTEKGTFSAGLGYLNNDGIVITTNYKRLNGHINGDYQIRDNLKVFGRLLYASRQDNNPTNANTFGRSIGLPPTAKYKFEDGTLAPGQSSSMGNNEYHLNTVNNKNIGDDLTLAFGAKLKILPGLSFDPQVSWWQTSGDARNFQKAFWNGPLSYVVSRAATSSYSKSLQKQADGVFTYIKTIKNSHNLEAKAGFSYYGSDSNSLTASGRDAATDLIPTLNASALPVSVSSTETEQVIYGYFGKINYDFNQKYLLSINARYDGASNLGDAYKWGLFPGVSVGWNVHKEEFWSSLPANLLKLKLRASYGVNGNISGLGPYTAQGQYNVGSQYGGFAAIQNTVIANSELQWEQSKTLDFGLDLGIFDNRVNIMFDVYRRETNNLLASLALPHSTGFSSTLTNLGSLENKGIELELNTRIMPLTSGFQWDLGFNISKVSNKILKLPYNGVKNNRIGGVEVWDQKTGAYVWKGGLQEGGTMGDYYIYKMLGVYATDAEATSAPKDNLNPLTDKKVYGGDAIIADLDGNQILDTRDQVYAGNIYPTWTGGFSNSFNYKNIGLYVRTDFTLGHTIYNYARGTLIGQFQGDNGLSKDLLRSWQKQGDVTDIPAFVYADQQVRNKLYRGGGGNTMFYEKGDYLAIRELTLTYDLPKTLLKRAKISGLRLNVTGHNLNYFTKFSGLNPEFGGQDSGRYPIPRNIIFGLNVTL